MEDAKDIKALSLVSRHFNALINSPRYNLKRKRAQAAALTKAVLTRKVSAVKKSLEHGDAQSRIDRGLLLCHAIKGERLEILQLLLSNGVFSNTISVSDLLYHAAGNGSTNLVDTLLAYGANPCHTKRHQQTPLGIASRNGWVLMAKKLLNCPGVCPNQRRHPFNPPIYQALRGGNTGVADILLNTGAIDVNRRYAKNRANLLYIAVSKRLQPVVDRLLRHDDLDPNVTHRGETPLFLAVRKNYLSVTRLLVNHKNTDIDQVSTDFNETPLLRALVKDYLAVVGVLMQAGANRYIPDSTGVSPDMLLTATTNSTKGELIARYYRARGLDAIGQPLPPSPAYGFCLG